MAAFAPPQLGDEVELRQLRYEAALLTERRSAVLTYGPQVALDGLTAAPPHLTTQRRSAHRACTTGPAFQSPAQIAARLIFLTDEMRGAGRMRDSTAVLAGALAVSRDGFLQAVEDTDAK